MGRVDMVRQRSVKRAATDGIIGQKPLFLLVVIYVTPAAGRINMYYSDERFKSRLQKIEMIRPGGKIKRNFINQHRSGAYTYEHLHHLSDSDETHEISSGGDSTPLVTIGIEDEDNYPNVEIGVADEDGGFEHCYTPREIYINPN